MHVIFFLQLSQLQNCSIDDLRKEREINYLATSEV